MKVFRNSVCYVSIDELKDESLPNYVNLDKIENDEFVVLSDEESMHYVKERKDIVDFDDVYYLTDEELDEKVKEAFERLRSFASRMLYAEEPLKDKLYHDKSYMGLLKTFDKYYINLKKYQNNREEINKKTADMVFSKVYQQYL